MSIQNNFPAVKPSLLLDFANVKKLDSRITFTRSTTANYYDGLTTVKAEENLLKYSEDFSNVDWVKSTTSVTSNSIIAPNGTLTADTITGTTGTVTKGISQGFSATTGLYTFSVYIKAGTHSFVQLWFAGGVTPSFNGYVNFDVSTGTIGSYSALGTPTVTNAGNGWYLCTYTTTFTAALGAYIYLIDSNTSARASSTSSTNDLYIWGTQLEQRTTRTSYTPTTSQIITNYIPAIQTAPVNTPRFDHNPVTNESLGLLIEEARTNFITYSEDITNAIWVKNNIATIPNTIIAPNGTLTGTKLIETATTGQHLILQQLTVSAVPYTFSCYVKAAEWTTFQVQLGNAGPRGDFNLTTGTAATALTATAATITSVGNGWYRCSVTATLTAGTIPLYMYKTAASYLGDGYSGIYTWGIQLEAGTFATSYIPTTSTTVTRGVDFASMTNSNFSSWYDALEGTMYVELDVLGLNSNGGVSSVVRIDSSSDTSTNSFRLGTIITGLDYYVQTATTPQVDSSTYAVVSNTFNKYAYTYKVNDFAVATNGGTLLTDAIGTLPVANQLIFAKDLFSGHLKKVTYYPVRITNVQLQAITG